MAIANFTFGPTHVRVAAPAAPLLWLEFFLRPWFTETGGSPPRSVELTMDEPRLNALAALAGEATQTADCFLLDSRVVRLPVVERHDGWTWAVDTDERVALGFAQDGTVRIVADMDGARARVALMRVVREIAVVDALADGRPLLHASIAADGDGAVAICGRKRSGKTTLLLHRLTSSSERYVANDRGVAFETGDGWRVRGLPSIVALRADTIARFPSVAGALREAPHRHWLTADELAPRSRPWADETRPIDLAPAQLCELLGVEAQEEAQLRTLLFPGVDPAVEGIEVRPLSSDEAHARLVDAQVGADFRLEYEPVLRASGAPGSAPSATVTQPDALTRLAAIAAFEVRLGQHAYQSAASR